MTIPEIKEALAQAYHEIGHAYAYVGQERLLAAQIAVGKARDAMLTVDDGLEELQNQPQTLLSNND